MGHEVAIFILVIYKALRTRKMKIQFFYIVVSFVFHAALWFLHKNTCMVLHSLNNVGLRLLNITWSGTWQFGGWMGSFCWEIHGQKFSVLTKDFEIYAASMEVDWSADIKAIDKGVKNKWVWEWLEEKDSEDYFLSDYVRKLDIAGMAKCIIYNETLKYGSSGKKTCHWIWEYGWP